MNPQTSDREELPARDRRWVAALQAQAPAGPPPALDAAVLAAARAAVGASTAASTPAGTGRGARPPRWLAAVAGVMVVLSAGVLVRQVAQETAPQEPEFPVSSQRAPEERAAAVMRAAREAEGLPAWETVEAAPSAAAVPEVSANAATTADSAERAIMQPPAEMAAARPAGASKMASARPADASSPQQVVRMEPGSAPAAPSAPQVAELPVADFAPVMVRPLGESAPAPAASSSPEHGFAAKSAQAERQQKAEAGLAVAEATEEAAALPEPEVFAEVRRLLAAGERAAARDMLGDWRERHPAAELPAELVSLLGEGE